MRKVSVKFRVAVIPGYVLNVVKAIVVVQMPKHVLPADPISWNVKDFWSRLVSVSIGGPSRMQIQMCRSILHRSPLK